MINGLRIRILGIMGLLLTCSPGNDVFGTSLELNVKIRGVYSSKISLSPFNGVKTAEAIAAHDPVAAGEHVLFEVPERFLPGEFLIRFDYKKDADSHPYPSELHVYLNENSITVNANPLYLRGDSLILGNDVENKAFFAYQQDLSEKRQTIALIEQLLVAYDRPGDRLYREAILAYKERVKAMNEWIKKQQHARPDLYVSRLFGFDAMIPVNWEVPETERINEILDVYFRQLDVKDSLILRSRQLNEFMGRYMNLWGQLGNLQEQPMDSLYVLAGQIACTMASVGHPKMYGWMVDYFYNGYEQYGIDEGIAMLRTHIAQPHCLTAKKQEIKRRLEGMEHIKVGSIAPPVSFESELKTYEYKPDKDKSYGLMIFYESDCWHCKEFLKELKEWYLHDVNRVWFDVAGFAFDEEKGTWEKNMAGLSLPWTDHWVEGGINSELGNRYYLLATPVIYIVDHNMKILEAPRTVREIKAFLNQ